MLEMIAKTEKKGMLQSEIPRYLPEENAKSVFAQVKRLENMNLMSAIATFIALHLNSPH